MFKLPKNSPKNKGFTLVELLIVVAIIAVLSGFLLPGFSNYIDAQNVRQAQELLKSDLRTAQNKALTGVGSSGGTKYWGIKFTDNNAPTYYFFSSTENTSTACANVNLGTSTTSETLPGGTVVRGASGSCVFFSTQNGDATVTGNNGSSIFSVAYIDESPCFGVEVNSAGMLRGVNLCN